jgi:hypothetical protein
LVVLPRLCRNLDLYQDRGPGVRTPVLAVSG